MKEQYLDDLTAKLASGRIDRRQFMTAALATGVSVSVATGVADKAKAATPKRGGEIRVAKGHGSTSDILDPGNYSDGYTISQGFGYHGYLTEVGSDGGLHPSIAESWEGSNGAKTWTFKIRKGATFHNGKTIEAQDVITSINHHRHEESTSAAKPLVAAVTDMKADGKDTVVFELEAGNADFPFALSDYHIPVLPDVDGKMDWKSGVGCGTYKLDVFDPGVGSELSRFENHWTDSVGFFDKIHLLSIIDQNARTAALVSGDVDAIDRVDLKTANLLGRKSGINIHSVTGTQHYTFPMLVDRAPYNDVNVRRALKHAVNRQELVDKILFGYGSIGNDHPIGSGQRFYNKDLAQTPYDLDKAKFYLKEAGMSSLSVELHIADAAFAGAVDAAVLYQNSAKGAGIDIKVVREPNDGYWSDVWLKKDWIASYWSGRPTEDLMFSTAYQSGVAWNECFWSNARFDELLLAARAETNDELRREMYYEMQAIVNDDGGEVIPMFASYVFAVNDRIGHSDTFATNWDMDGERWMERWWIKS